MEDSTFHVRGHFQGYAQKCCINICGWMLDRVIVL